VVSGTPLHRPKGQTKADDQPACQRFGPSRLLDFELEVGFVVGKETQLGDSISTANAEEYIFGLLLFNDWSARDVQKWEYVPLGPFLAKNFGSSVSPWIVTLEALEPFRVASPRKSQPRYLTYNLKDKKITTFN
jgi:fumarylacetoacetase